MALIISDVYTGVLAESFKALQAGAMPTSLNGVAGDLGTWTDNDEENLEDWLDNRMERLGNWVDQVSDTPPDAEAEAFGLGLDTLEDELEDYPR